MMACSVELLHVQVNPTGPRGLMLPSNPPPPKTTTKAPTTTTSSHFNPNANAFLGRLIKSSRSCSTMSMPKLKQYHSQFIRLGLSSDNHAMAPLINSCALSKSGDFGYALKLFDLMPHPDAFLYNTIIRGYLLLLSNTQPQLPIPIPPTSIINCILLLYSQMLSSYVLPNAFTFPSLIRACCLEHALEQGKQLHAQVLKFGFRSHPVSHNNLIHMYLNFHCFEEARRVFDWMPHRDIVSWTTLISGYSQWGCVDQAFQLFELMPQRERQRNSASWNAIIAAYVRHNRFHEAFALFHRMRAEKVAPDKYVAATMLSACTGLGALKQGEWIHGYIQKMSTCIELDSKLATSIIDMYCKCGCLEKASGVFNRLTHNHKGISSWNSMIGGLALHGKGMAAIELLKEMEEKAIPPDYITFVNVLNACAHSGLVEEGRYYFDYMTQVHGIEPGSEHFGCMVHLLGRAGLLEEARELINAMPTSPDASVLGALLGACRIHGEIELGEQIGQKLIELEPHNSGRYILLANIYADAGKWRDVANVRKLMNERGVKKAPGFSMIEIESAVNEFIAGGRDHPQAKDIYAKVDEMLEQVRSIGYVPHTNGVVHYIDEEERESPLYYHSEKLAIGLGLLNTKPGETLRIMKNLRVCIDCHTVSKLVSKIYDREIIVRDSNRFHHFRGGECSCNDYW